MADLNGHMLGQYRIGELIGRGGMAGVYRARQESMDRDVAIKVMAAELAGNAEFVARFEREARVIAKLQHPHILPVIDFGRSSGNVYLVMRLVEGGVLSDRLTETTLTLRQVDQFLTQIASALEYAHQRGVIHRDLKPNNVLLDDQDNVYLTDFGIAKMLAGSTGTHSLTATGSVMGTPAYMAPEQWRSEPVDARTDIYALGVILYEMLMGALPFQSDTPFGMMYKHFDQAPPLPRAINPQIPATAEGVVLRALAKDPGDRFASARDMAETFTHVVAALPPAASAARLPRATSEQIERATPPAGHSAALPAASAATATAATAPVGYSAGGLPPAPPPTQMTAHLPPPEPAASSRGRGRGLLVGGALAVVALIAVVVIAVLALNGGNGKGKTTPEPLVAGGESLTPGATITAGGAITILDLTPTLTVATLAPTLTATGESPVTQVVVVPSATATASATPTATVTDTPTASPSPTDTPDLNATAAVLVAQRLTQTAQSWTDTPTPNIEETVIAALTGTANAWTDTPTPTPTFTATVTPSPTATVTPLPTVTTAPTLTLPPPPTRTPFPTATPLLFVTATPFPTRTMFVTATPVGSACGSMPSRVTANSGARTTLSPADPTRVRAVPGLSAAVVRSIPPGQTFWITAGPQCADGVTWWQVLGYDETGAWSGWIGEGANRVYWIEPFETGPIDCPGAPAPRLVPGETGRITLNPPLPSRVRSKPGTDGTVTGQLQPGETFTVITGPVCDTANHWRWWQVRARTLEGWVAEGPIGQYWMEPYP